MNAFADPNRAVGMLVLMTVAAMLTLDYFIYVYYGRKNKI